MVPDVERAMTQISLYAKTVSLGRVLFHACLFVAVTAAVFSGMMAIDRPERLSTLAYMQCADCSHGTGSPDRLQADSNTDSCLQQLLQLLHPGEGRGDGMAAILRE
jgi:hypothetical protein